jgi:hypothetical protein
MEREETHEHQPRSPQFWEDVGDAWNRFIGKDEEEEEEPTSTRRSTGRKALTRQEQRLILSGPGDYC